jgi:hypothetical protein
MKEFKPESLFENIEDVETLKSLPNDYIESKVILGIDIYRYSQYPVTEQIYIPVLFNALYDAAVANIQREEKFIFQEYGQLFEDFREHFISTGDGGFQIFSNPIQAIVFALCFQINVRRFISGSNKFPFRKKLHKIIDNIELRYAITSDLIYRYKSSFFGPGIINNARILAKDNLNRLLIDENTIKWFTNNINSVENLLHIDKKSFLLTDYFKNYNIDLSTHLFNPNRFRTVDVLKIGRITSKATFLDVYNLHIQAILPLAIDKHQYNQFVISLGNLNTAGIN